MSLALPDLKVVPARVVVVGDGGSSLARGLRACGHLVEELLPSDFQAGRERMADVVAVLPSCPDPDRVGAVAAACARCVWFQDQSASPELVEMLEAVGVPVAEGRDLLAEVCP